MIYKITRDDEKCPIVPLRTTMIMLQMSILLACSIFIFFKLILLGYYSPRKVLRVLHSTLNINSENYLLNILSRSAAVFCFISSMTCVYVCNVVTISLCPSLSLTTFIFSPFKINKVACVCLSP